MTSLSDRADLVRLLIPVFFFSGFSRKDDRGSSAMLLGLQTKMVMVPIVRFRVRPLID